MVLKLKTMIKSLKILFYIRRDKPNLNGTMPLYCRITVEGQRAVFDIKRAILPKKWDSIKGCVKGSTEEAKSINTYINSLKAGIYDIQHKLERENKIVSADSIKSLLIGEPQVKSKSLFVVFEGHNNKVKSLINSDFAQGTYERYQTCLKHLKEFVKLKYNKSEFLLTDVNHEFITEFDYFFRSHRKCANNTTVRYMKNFKKIIKIALANSWIASDPFLNHKMKLKKVDRGYLTQPELDLLMQKNFTIKRIEQVRDVFIFQCYTGLAYCDTKKLTKKNLFLDVEGIFWVKTRRTKTDTEVSVPLLPKALEILEKYKDYSINDDSSILPVLSNQKMNSYLKEIGDICGIDKRLSCHLSRHTFGTTITLGNGLSIEAVSKMLGHTSINTTKIYARMLDSRVSTEMSNLSDKLKLK